MNREAKEKNLINHKIYDELYSLMEDGHVPTKIELDRFIKSLGYRLAPSLPQRELREKKLGEITHLIFEFTHIFISTDEADQILSLISPVELPVLTKDEMVKALWEAGNKYELEGGKLDNITQELRFLWISQATVARIKEVNEL